jgi:hypothetical protein
LAGLFAQSLKKWLARQLLELERDAALRWYGVALASAHLLAFCHWTFVQPAARLLGPAAMPVCWPFFEDCAKFRGLSVAAWSGVLCAYAALALGMAVAFAARRVRFGYGLACALVALHAAITLQDYRLRLNQHYMLFWVGLLFLFALYKRLALRALLVAFYFWAALLKLNGDWLSGQALAGSLPLLVPRGWLPAACAYVVVLELCCGIGLFSRRPALFWGTLLQLALFHAVSYSVVGFFYPLLMGLLLSLFVLVRAWPDPQVDALRGRRLPALASVAAFSMLQLWPATFPGDPVLTGQGRALALHMFDAKVGCRAVATLHFRAGPPEARAMTSRLPGRIACDPLVYFHFARAVCGEQSRNAGFVDLDWSLESRRGGRGPLTRVVDLHAFCRFPPHYSAFFANSWIHSEPAASSP